MAHIGATGDGKFWKTYSSPEELTATLGTSIHKIGMQAYCESKLANILHMREMAKRHPSIKFMSVHPGVVNSSFADKIIDTDGATDTWFGWLMSSRFCKWLFPLLIKSSVQGFFSYV